MVEVRLTQNIHKTIVTLNANMIQYFYATEKNGGRSMHVGHIKSIEITTDKKGKHKLLITTELFTFLDHEVDDTALEKVKELVAEVQRAMQSTTL